MRKVLLLLSVLLSSFWPVHGGTQGAVDSRDIRVVSLVKPMPLSGTWEFTREPYDPAHPEAGPGAGAWKLIRTPGPWKGVYPDRQNFTKGWYRGTFTFDPSLVGAEVVLLIDTYMGRMKAYLDGACIYERPSDHANLSRYHSVQPVPIRFRVTQPRHVFALQVETPLMTGVYALPFEMHRYDSRDLTLSWYQFRGGEMRMLIGFVVLFFGLFFLLVYSKVRYPLYLVAASGSLVVFIFAAAPADFLLTVLQPETTLYLHYVGLFAAFIAYLFSQFFYKFTPRLNWVLGVVYGVLGLVIGSMSIHPNVNVFQHVRSVYFLLTLTCGIAASYMFVRGILAKRPGAGILLVGIGAFLIAGVNDLLLALGRIHSMPWMFIGISVYTATMLFVTSNIFANTFLENKQLVRDLKKINDKLEDLVAERTAQLRQKTMDVSAMLQNMPQGILTVDQNGTIHPEYSAYLETIFETADIAGQNLMQLVFSGSSLGPDVLAQVEAVPGACVLEDRMNFDFNTHIMVKEFERRMPDGRVKALELVWSPICNDQDVIEKLMICVRDTTEVKRLEAEASQQRRELEMIGQILSVSQEKFHEFIDSSERFIAENANVIRATDDKQLEIITQLFRNMHTIKGNARTYGLLHLTNKVHETEQKYDELRKDPDAAWDKDLLLCQLEETHALIAEYAKINDQKLGRKGPGRRGGVEKYLMVEKDHIGKALQLLEGVDKADLPALQGALRQVSHSLNLIGTESIHDILAPVFESIPSLAAELGKMAPRITVLDHGILLRSQVAGLLKNLFTHLFRNAVDHGIEGPEERDAMGKPPEGQVSLEMALTGGKLVMTLRDDGRGLPITRIRQLARARGLLAEGAEVGREQLANLIFLSGFSTADRVTEVSGRGVGMDAVKGFLEREGGTIEIRFLEADPEADFLPFETVLTLPDKFAVKVQA